MKKHTMKIIVGVVSLLSISIASGQANDQKSFSGIYPGLTMFNNEGECGIGAVVPWQDDLWVITYAPHQPLGSTDKLYQITPDLQQVIFPGSVGGTPANRMIHRESNQLLIGPYLIDAEKNIRVIPPSKMYGRLTGNARHLVDPKNKVYYATMEEGLYSMDVRTLDVECLIRDGNGNAPKVGIQSNLPGYHGKGLYSGQGRVAYSNNGERSKEAEADPTISSGALGQWFGEGDWQLVRRNQFTEVTGPNGIYGSDNPETDPIWSLGWDERSLLLALLEDAKWSYYRLPKGSHSYDGAHGWNTEWPRIREISGKDLLATMHGTFWRFPPTFSLKNSAGIVPRSNYLKVIGDFCNWNGKLVFGCDDSARNEFLNKRSFKAEDGAPKQSNSNLWFVDSQQLDRLGPVIGRGSVWLRDDVAANTPSDPYLFSGYDDRQLTLAHRNDTPVTFTLELDRNGNNTWTRLKTVEIPAKGSKIVFFSPEEQGAWIRITTDQATSQATAHFQYRNRDRRTHENAAIFEGIATAGNSAASGGIMRSLAYNKLGLEAVDSQGQSVGYYQLNQDMTLVPMKKPEDFGKAVAQPENGFQEDAASFVMKEDGQTFRLPKSPGAPDHKFGAPRLCREVATERDLLNLGGTFYELPARNAQGFFKMRPVSTHHLAIQDFCSHSGLLLLTGINDKTAGAQIIRSEDGKAAVWAGVIDDLWKLGKPRGIGGPWKDTAVKPNSPSDPYLMTAYDKKSVQITTHDDAKITIEVDVDGTGLWIPYKTFAVTVDQPIQHSFPEGFSAYWVRAISDVATTATVELTYE